MSNAVAVGDAAPEFTKPDQKGNSVSLAQFRGKPVVLYFYPNDDGPVCTKQACAFRDSYQDFVDAGAEVIGVSSDSVASHEKFAGKHRLPYVLLADEGGELRSLYGVPKAILGLMPGRVTYVIDGGGIVRGIYNSMLAGPKHVTEALEILRTLK